MRSLCVVHTCKNQGKHLFPQDPILRRQWVNALMLDVIQMTGRQLKKYAYICSDHFRPSDFIIRPPLFVGDHGTKRLKKKSVPSILPWMVVQNQTPSGTPQEDTDFTIHFSELPRRTYGKTELPIAFVEEIPFILSEPNTEEDPLQLKNEKYEIEEYYANIEMRTYHSELCEGYNKPMMVNQPCDI